MQKANHILQAIRKMGEKRVPLTRVYRSLYSEDLFLAAYNKIYRNQGALTPGTEDDTVDGMSIKRIRSLIADLRYERFRYRPSRRVYGEKKGGGKRPLGIPNFTEKLVEEALRMILDAYYEPRFRESSHGFRPGRGCHTALTEIKQSFRGSAWFIEGDIRGCFDNIDHDILLGILARDIHDGRLLSLIRMCLEAGVMEEWEYHKTYCGTPQGGVLSPILSNIYMHELDVFIEDELIPQYTRGDRRATNPEYRELGNAIARARRRSDTELAQQLEQQRREIPSVDAQDSNFRRLRYVRYADDFILSFIGTKSEAEAIKAAIGEYLRDRLRLEMNASKTLITHARTEHARFLGYAISIYHADDKITRNTENQRIKRRSANGKVRLGVPYGLVDEYAKRYMQNGKPIHESALLAFSDAHIIDTYQARFRGLAEYYKFAVDRHCLNTLKGIMQVALVKTLASKYRSTVGRIYRKYRGTQTVEGYEYKTLQVDVPTKKGKRTIYWGAIPLRVVEPSNNIALNSDKYFDKYINVRSDLVQRLQADTCELCGSQENCEVHHVRKLSDLKRRWTGRKQKPDWVVRMIAMHRKTLVVCHECHVRIHAGKPTPKSSE